MAKKPTKEPTKRILSASDFRSFYLPGTVALPPYPTPGTIAVGVWEDEESGSQIRVLTVSQWTGLDSFIARTVELRHVAAIALVDSETSIDKATWYFQPQVEKLAAGLAESARGVLFVPENTPIRTEVIFGATAAESAEYRAPGPRGCESAEWPKGCE
jgi:hypothetical protein